MWLWALFDPLTSSSERTGCAPDGMHCSDRGQTKAPPGALNSVMKGIMILITHTRCHFPHHTDMTSQPRPSDVPIRCSKKSPPINCRWHVPLSAQAPCPS